MRRTLEDNALATISGVPLWACLTFEIKKNVGLNFGLLSDIAIIMLCNFRVLKAFNKILILYFIETQIFQKWFFNRRGQKSEIITNHCVRYKVRKMYERQSREQQSAFINNL